VLPQDFPGIAMAQVRGGDSVTTPEQVEAEHLEREEAKRIILQNVTMYHREAETALANRFEAIKMALSLDATWDQIGESMGMSRQAAHRRFNNGIKG
jgi:predicted DNA-binding protein (UPF0251 family)